MGRVGLCTKNEVFHLGFLLHLEFPADLVTLTEKISSIKLHFLYSGNHATFKALREEVYFSEMTWK